MDKKRFVDDYVNGRKAQQSTVTLLHNDITREYFEIIRGLKGFIKYVRFDCQFNRKTGGCKENPLSRKCCCYSCMDNVGYLQLMAQENIPFYARHFSPKTGFWRESKGCILPHHMRSITCLTHNCNYRDQGHPHFRDGMFQIKRLMRNSRELIFKEDRKLRGEI
jgi:hypothetical protein